ncbi:murein hydrolase activator EnvC family protein [Thiohalocapsa marina]|uniref:murein hydrolase activator EnvC family protein n=1 Tax=Thiohalocapsa marina TaxID=424902 RepID=UPI0036DA199B
MLQGLGPVAALAISLFGFPSAVLAQAVVVPTADPVQGAAPEPVPELPDAAPPQAQSGASQTPDVADMAARERELDRLEASAARLQQALVDREQRREDLYRELERSERDIAALARAGRELRLLVDEQQATVAELDARLQRVHGELAAARSSLAALLRAAYARGRGDRLRLLLDGDDLVLADRMLGYARCLGEARARRIAEVGQLAEQLSALQDRAATEAERLQRLADRQDETRQRLAMAQQERAVLVDGLDRLIAADRDRLSQLTANAEALRSLIEQLRRQAEIADELDVNPESIVARKGRLDWPLPRARLISRFRPGSEDQDLHADGVLLAADAGGEVRAVHHGRVIYADWLRGFGLLLVIDHGDDVMTLYGHNQTLLKEVGEWVATGDGIALAGGSGGSLHPGLYFAVRRQGRPLDPEHWCAPGRG